MVKTERSIGFAIAIAWPETYCKQPGSWYDEITRLVGINPNHYYKAGHAALVLADGNTGRCHYFDFGRYHSPFNHGRVRNEISDHGLKLKTMVKISPDANSIENFTQILAELQRNDECHGDGTIYASYGIVDFQKSFEKALELQKRSPLPYGPFIPGGSNCSRFVYESIVAGIIDWKLGLRFRILKPFTPTPMSNVRAFKNREHVPPYLPFRTARPKLRPMQIFLETTLAEPNKPKHIPVQSQWLSGEGAGSFFHIEQHGNHYLMQRFGPEGEIECSGEFEIIGDTYLDVHTKFTIDYPSHCDILSLHQNGKRLVLQRISE